MPKLLLVIGIFLPLLLSSRPKFPHLKTLVSGPDFRPVEENLKKAGENGLALYDALQELTPESRPAAAFLIANMPPIDLVEMDKETFLEHIRYAYKVREKYLWAKNLSSEKFLHYVLPYRMSQEPIERWRKYFYDELEPIVKDLKTAAEVALKVNEWCGKKIGFKPTARRDQVHSRPLSRAMADAKR